MSLEYWTNNDSVRFVLHIGTCLYVSRHKETCERHGLFDEETATSTCKWNVFNSKDGAEKSTRRRIVECTRCEPKYAEEDILAMLEALEAPEEEIMTLEEYDRLRAANTLTWNEGIMDAAELFEGAIEWLRRSYSDYQFFAEYDVVKAIKAQLSREIERHNLPYFMVAEYTVPSAKRADLVVLCGNSVEVAAEFKYEPCHSRNTDFGGDITKGKFPVVFWTEVEKDVQRVREYAASGHSKIAYSTLVDEGNHFSYRNAPAGSEWMSWTENMSVLWSRQHA